jgi:hypothetical protein
VAGCLSKCLTIVPPKTEWGRTLLYARRVSMPDRGEPSRVHTEEVTVEESSAATALTSGRSGRPGRAGFGTKRFRETACPQRAPVHPSSAVDSPRRSRIAQRQTTPALTNGHRPQEMATEGELYALFLERLDLLLNATRADAFLKDRLDAQGLAWLIATTTSSPVESRTEEENAEFQTWRTGKTTVAVPSPPPDPNDQQARPTSPPSPRSLEDLAESLYMGRDNTKWLEETITLLKHRGQVIIQGPPGTGKTYIGRAIAEFLADNPEQSPSCSSTQGRATRTSSKGSAPTHPILR